MKKFTLILALIFLVSVIPSAYADDNMQAVLVSVKERVNVPEEYTEFSSNVYSHDGDVGYSFYWETPEEAESWGYLNVSVDDEGIINSVHGYDGRLERGYKRGKTIPKISESEAQKTASEYFARINPSVFNEFAYDWTDCPYGSYNISFVRLANGIKTSDTANLSIDGETGTVTDFYMSYTKVSSFVGLDGALDIYGAKAAFKNGNALNTIYRTFGDNKEAKIVYTLSDFNIINAFTGEKFTYSADGDNAEERNEKAAEDTAASALGGSALTVKEISALDEIDGLLKTDEIVARLRAVPELGLDGAEIESTRLEKRSDDKYIMNLYLTGENRGFWANADAKSGQMTSFNAFRNESGETEIADDFIQKYYPEYVDRTVLKNNRRTRCENGIEFPQNGIYASKDKETGYITYFTLDFDETVTFASPVSIISEDEAYNTAFELAEPELKYVFNEKNAVPVYTVSFDYFAYIDAESGKPVNYAGEVQTRRANEKYEYYDISGHYAEAAVNALASVGVGFEGGAFEPDTFITQSDFASLVSQCVYDYVIYRNGLFDKAATANGCIINGAIKQEEYYPDEPLSREKAVQILLKAMGYEEFASIEGIFKTDFADSEEIDPALLGYTAIAAGLKIVQGNGGYFFPKANITRAQAAVIIYNYLKR